MLKVDNLCHFLHLSLGLLIITHQCDYYIKKINKIKNFKADCCRVGFLGRLLCFCIGKIVHLYSKERALQRT